MAINSIGANGVQGLNRALEQADQASRQIARANIRPDEVDETQNPQATPTPQPAQTPEPTDLVQPLVELREAELNARANARSIEAENQIIGSLLDIRA